jgi:hypothetical protein
MTRQAKCENGSCRSMNAILCERTNPRNFSVEYVRLCSKCRAKLGIAPPSGGTAHTNRYRLTEKGGTGNRVHHITD